MTIARESPAQKGGAIGDAVASQAYAFPNAVQLGSLIVIIAMSDGGSAFVAGDCAKSAGTATIDTVQLDKDQQNASGQQVGIWSAKVTGAGSLTMTVTPSTSSFLVVTGNAYTGSWDGTRTESTNGANGTTGTTPSSGNATSAAAGLFIGGLAVGNGQAVTLTEDGNWQSIFESLDGTAHEVGESIDRIVSTGTTDDVNWTISAAPNSTAAAIVVYRESTSGTVKVMSDTLTLSDQAVSSVERFIPFGPPSVIAKIVRRVGVLN